MRERRARWAPLVIACVMAHAALDSGAAQDTSRAVVPTPPSGAESAGVRTQPPGAQPVAAATPEAAAPRPSQTPQTAADYIAAGDREREAMQARQALADFEQAIALDSNSYDALYKASREAVDLGEFEPNPAAKANDFETGLRFGERATVANPTGPDGHFAVARALGRQALAVGGKKRIQFAKQVRAEALAALSYDPNHAGALHVMGVWNAEVMRLSGIERFIARNLLGGGVLGTASWKEAVRYLEEAVSLEPKRIVHHLDLGKVYGDIGEKSKARQQFELVLSTPPAEYNDPHYKDDAQRHLARLGSG
jgi:tetratricopeptide (TPR) repeat protein